MGNKNEEVRFSLVCYARSKSRVNLEEVYRYVSPVEDLSTRVVFDDVQMKIDGVNFVTVSRVDPWVVEVTIASAPGARVEVTPPETEELGSIESDIL